MWSLSSRAHRLNCFPKQGVQCYVKRDDELGCGINGTKLRKYASIIPFFKTKDIRHLIIIGGAQSNNLLAALQVARELQLKVTLFLLKPKYVGVRGNLKLSLLFIDERDIVWVERNQWQAVQQLAENYQTTLRESSYILTEGASIAAAMNGAMSLAADIRRNEQELGITFQHIFIDAGTGFSAAALLKGLSQSYHQAVVHILLLADDEEQFKQKLTEWVDTICIEYHCFYPKTAASFGALNHTIKAEIRRLAKEEGILAEPIYSAKLFHEARFYIQDKKLTGNILIIHSGGLLSLAGFDLMTASL